MVDHWVGALGQNIHPQSFHFIRSECRSKINYVEPGKNAVENGPKDRTITRPRRYDSNDAAETDTDFGNLGCGVRVHVLRSYFLGNATFPVRVRSRIPKLFISS